MIKEHPDGTFEKFKYERRLKEILNEKEADKYLQFSFKKNFLINGKEIEIYEPPKILGDIFEALIGAIFRDGGIEKVIEVFEPLLSPFILFVAKFNKRLFKEPKEDFFILANLLKIKPELRAQELKVDNMGEYVTH